MRTFTKAQGKDIVNQRKSIRAELKRLDKSALNENVKGLAFQAAFLKATNSVFKAAILCALRSK